jgi:hypothetical protein
MNNRNNSKKGQGSNCNYQLTVAVAGIMAGKMILGKYPKGCA